MPRFCRIFGLEFWSEHIKIFWVFFFKLEFWSEQVKNLLVFFGLEFLE